MSNAYVCLQTLVQISTRVIVRSKHHWAAACSVGPDVVEVLINNGAVMDARDQLQLTPLHRATGINCIESAQKLIATRVKILYELKLTTISYEFSYSSHMRSHLQF